MMEFRDVTDDARFSLLDDVVFMVSPDNTWLHLTPAWHTLTGFTVTASLGQPITNYWHPADRPALLELIKQLRERSQQKVAFTGRFMTASGDTRRLELVMTRQSADQREALFGVLRPETSVPASTKPVLPTANSQNMQRIQRIVDHMPVMVACLRRDLHITFANIAYATNFGLPVEQVIGKSVFDILHPSQHTQVREHLTSLSQYNPLYVFEHWTTRPNGEQRYQRWTDHVFFDDDGHISEYQTVGIDLTKRKHIEDQLRQSENKFRGLVESSLDLVFEVDMEGKFTYISPSWYDVLGYAPEDFIGKTGISIVHIDDAHRVGESLHNVLTGTPQVESTVYRVKHADGSWRWHATRGAAIKDAEGKVIGAVGIARDITDNQHYEQALKDSLEQLEHALAHNQTLMRELHHRVKNNLQIISSLLNLQAHRLEDSVAKESLQASRSRVMAMAEIHTMMYQHERIDHVMFDDYLHSLIDRIKHAYGLLGITFAVTGDSLELSVNHAIPLGLIVNELITNAVKYAFPPTISKHPTINIDLHHEADTITVVVHDNGVGMPEGFDPISANALGTTIVQSLTQQLDGQVTYAAGDGGGVQVTVRVPVALARAN